MRNSASGLGKIPVIPAITGTWPLGFFPDEVQIAGSVFQRATWASPFEGAVAQYREVVEYDAMHLLIYRNGTFVIDHLDEANPDQGHVLEHAVLDKPLMTTLACGLAGFGLGLVGGLLLMGQSYGQENPTTKLSQAQVDALDKFAQAGGHGFGSYAYLSKSTAWSLAHKGYIRVGSVYDSRTGRSRMVGAITPEGLEALHAATGHPFPKLENSSVKHLPYDWREWESWPVPEKRRK